MPEWVITKLQVSNLEEIRVTQFESCHSESACVHFHACQHNCPGNGTDLKNGNDFRNAIVSDHSHACQHKLFRKWKWPQEWKSLQECNWRNNFVNCHTKQECWIEPNLSCWCLLQKWNTLETSQTSFLRLKLKNSILNYTSNLVSFQRLFLTLQRCTLRYIKEFDHTFICGFWKIYKNDYRHRVLIHHLGKARGEVQCRHPGF